MTTAHHPIESPSRDLPPIPKRWTLAEYYQLIARGLLDDQRLELVDGEILQISPHGGPHALTITLVQEVLLSAFGEGHVIRVQLPLSIPPNSEPEPDFAVVRGHPRDFPKPPQCAELVVEISETSLDFDLFKKAGLYASAKIPDYWVIDIVGRRAIVHRQPVADPAAFFGHRYADICTLAATDKVSPLAKPDSFVQVSDILP